MVQTHLIDVANRFTYLDRCFAIYFQLSVSLNRYDSPKERLEEAWAELKSQQSSSTPYIGDLGEFCEDVLRRWDNRDDSNNPFTWEEFRSSHYSSQDFIQYLQDALELPYWKFILQWFFKYWMNANPNSVLTTGMMYILCHVRTDCRRWLERIRVEVEGSADQKSFEVVAEGIRKRLMLLDSFLLPSFRDPDDLDNDIWRKSVPVKVSDAYPMGPNYPTNDQAVSRLMPSTLK